MQIAIGTTRYVPGVCVQPWSELPLWIPDKFNMEGMLTMSTEKALAAGLKFRPLKETIIDTLAWESSRDVAEKKAGLDPAKEKRVLEIWRQS